MTQKLDIVFFVENVWFWHLELGMPKEIQKNDNFRLGQVFLNGCEATT